MRMLACSVLILAAGAAELEWPAGTSRRVPVTVTTFGVAETDAPVHVRLNFTPLLGEGERLAPATIRVFEHDPETGAVLAEAPCLFQPVDEPWPSAQPLSWQKPDDPATPPNIAASSENPAKPARLLVERAGVWEAGSATPPWIVAVDLGEVRTVNAVYARPQNDGRGSHAPTNVDIEVATASPDGLREGDWERVGGWQLHDPRYIFGMNRPTFFAPRPVRYVRAVIRATTRQQPWLAALDVYRPFWDAATRAEGRVSWFVPGTTEAPRRFAVYFAAGDPAAAAAPERVAIIQEAEEAVDLFQPSGIRFGRVYDATASGPTSPNMLSVRYKVDRFELPAGFAVRIPRQDSYTIAFRARGNAGDHGLHVLVDDTEVYAGVLSLEGEDWNVVSLPPLELPAGIHYLEFLMRLGTGDKPLDLDVVTIVNAPELAVLQGLRAAPGELETRP